jgi:hypothetical protein
MKGEKEPKLFKYPRLYFQKGKRKGWCKNRIRLIEPNGTTHWICDSNLEICYSNTGWGSTCWAPKIIEDQTNLFGTAGKCRNGQSALAKMRKYDKEEGLKPAIFIGEIK